MKKTQLILALALASGCYPLFAQQTVREIPYSTPSRTEQMFNTPRTGTMRLRFELTLPLGNSIHLEFGSVNQVDSLPDLDSLLRGVWTILAPFRDSLSQPLSSQRVDVQLGDAFQTVRIVQYPQQGTIYRITGSDTAQLKVEQDTLRVRLQIRPGSSPMRGQLPPARFYYVTLLINNLSELPEVLDQSKLDPVVRLLRSDLAKPSNSRAVYSFTRVYARYDVATVRRIIPRGDRLMTTGSKSLTLAPPYIQVGIQYLRGAWAPSAQLGLDYKKSFSETSSNHYRLLWEPYFFFSKMGDASPRMDRNDFITLKFNQTSRIKLPNREITYYSNVSLGYLVNRKGNWLAPHTFKFALPGLQTSNILIEPEFLFHDLLKGFSPSLKAALFFQ